MHFIQNTFLKFVSRLSDKEKYEGSRHHRRKVKDFIKLYIKVK